MEYGKIFVDSEIDRLNVKWESGNYGDGFHCGDVIEINVPQTGEWGFFRIEYNHSEKSWYFVGLPKEYGNIPHDIITRKIT